MADVVVGMAVSFVLSTATSYLLSMFQKQEGPRLSDQRMTGSSYGSAIPTLYGTQRVAGNLIWSTDFKEVRTEEDAGGKGGGGSITVYSYYGTFAIALCQGPVYGIRRVWADGKLILDRREANDEREEDPGIGGASSFLGFAAVTGAGFAGEFNVKTSRLASVNAYLGTETQEPDGVIESYEGIGNVPAHRGLCYIVFEDLPLDDFGNRIPNIEAEIVVEPVVSPSYPTKEIANTSGYTPEWISGAPNDPFLFISLSLDKQLRKISTVAESAPFLPQYLFDIDAANGNLSWNNFDYAWEEAHGVTKPTVNGPLVQDPRDGGNLYAPLVESTYGGILELSIQMQFERLIYLGQYNVPDYVRPTWFRVQVAGGNNNKPGRRFEYTSHGLLVHLEDSNESAHYLRQYSYHTLDRSTRVLPNDRPSDVPGADRARFAVEPNYDWSVDSPGKLVDIAAANVMDTRESRSHMWVLLSDSSNQNGEIASIVDGSSPALTALTDLGFSASAVVRGIYYNTTEDNLALITDDGVYKIDTDVTTVEESDTAIGPLDGSSSEAMYRNFDYASNEIGIKDGDTLIRYRLSSMAQITSLDIAGTYGGSADDCIIDVGTEALFRPESVGGNVEKLVYMRTPQQSVDISDVIDSVCENAGLEASEYDTTAVTGTVDGYAIGSVMSAREALQPLLAVAGIDAVETDGQLVFFDEKSAVDQTITEGELVLQDEANWEIEESVVQARELPRRVVLNYTASSKSFETASQQSQRIQTVVEANAEEVMTFPGSLADQQAADYANEVLKRLWAARKTYKFTLPPKYLRLDPGDVVTLTRSSDVVSSLSTNVRILKSEYQDGLVSIEAQGMLDSSVAGESDLEPGHIGGAQSLNIPFNTRTEMVLLDIPSLRGRVDADDGGLYVGLYPAHEGVGCHWSGGTLFSGSGGVDGFVPGVSSTQITPNGYAPSPLGSITNWAVWDDTNSLEVDFTVLGDWEPSSATDADVLNGANYLIVGDEIIQYGTVVQGSYNTYTFSHLLRGRFGTELQIPQHDYGERVIVPGNWLRRTSGYDKRGVPVYYKAITHGNTLSRTNPNVFVHNSVSLRPYAPVHFEGTRDGSDNLTLTWVRRVRYNGELADEVDVPLDQRVEQYEIDIYDGDDIVRTITVDDATTVVYTAAEQTTDFGAAQSSIDMVLYQISDTVGRGFGAEATI